MGRGSLLPIGCGVRVAATGVKGASFLLIGRGVPASAARGVVAASLWRRGRGATFAAPYGRIAPSAAAVATSMLHTIALTGLISLWQPQRRDIGSNFAQRAASARFTWCRNSSFVRKLCDELRARNQRE